MRVRKIFITLILLAITGCRPVAPKVLPIQAAESKPINGAFGKSLGERWSDLAEDAQPPTRADLYVFNFTPAKPEPGLTRYRAWVLPATMEICRLSGGGDFADEKSFTAFFQDIESRFGHLVPLTPAESFKPHERTIWTVTHDGRTVLVVRRADGRVTVDLFDVFLGSRPIEKILSTKGADDSEF